MKRDLNDPGHGTQAGKSVNLFGKWSVNRGLLRALYFTCLLINFAAAPVQAQAWMIEFVDAPKYIKEGKIVVDSSGNPHIAYGGDYLYHAWFDGEAWNTETVDSTTIFYIYSQIDIAIDSADNVHICYDKNGGDFTLEHTTNATGSWVSETVDAVAGSYSVGRYSSIAIDSIDNVHISYYDSHDEIKYAANTTGTIIMISNMLKSHLRMKDVNLI